jgi:hypothetical protein
MQSKVPLSTRLFQALWREQRHHPLAAREQHHHFLATRDPASGKFSNIPVRSDHHASEIVLRSVNSGLDVYLAPASFQSSNSRKAENAIGAMSLWLDIDVCPEKAATSKGYATIEDAKAALVNFCVSIKIQQPTHIVHSGTGIQAYWILDTFLPKAQWQSLTRQFKALCSQHGLLADPCRTSDIASLMRVPGTFNHKYSPPRTVTLERASSESIPSAIIIDAINAALSRLPQRDPSPARSFETDEKTFDLAICVAALRCLDPDMPYPNWFRVAAVLFNYSKGSEVAYELFDTWSRGGNKYKCPKDTRRVWQSLNPDHPNPIGLGTLCLMVREAGFDWEQDVLSMAKELEGEV